MKIETNNTIVVKIGGSTLGEHDTTIQDVVELQKKGIRIIVVHGGGKMITDWQEKLGLNTRFVRGKRVTDKPSLEVAVSVLAGLVNKEIVTSIVSAGGRAAGISGVDGSLIEGSIENAEMGYVGRIDKIDVALLDALLIAGFVPVIATIGFNRRTETSDNVRTLNINADTAAGEIAAVVRAGKLVFLTDVEGVLDKAGKLFSTLSPAEAEALVKGGVASGGMIPKLEACLMALQGGAAAYIVDGRKSHALRELMAGGSGGTVIK